MKKTLIILGFILLGINAQSTAKERVFITGFMGYTFADNFNMGSYSGNVNDGMHFGGSIEFLIKNLYGVELLYQYQKTDAEIYDLYNRYKTDLGISYIMAGGMRYQSLLNGMLLPYFGVNLGVGIIAPDITSSQTRFAWGAKLGMKIRATNFLAFRVQAQINSIVNGIDGSTMWIGPGGVSLGLDSYSSIYQVGFTVGASIAF